MNRSGSVSAGPNPICSIASSRCNSSSFSTWTTQHGGKAAVNAQLR